MIQATVNMLSFDDLEEAYNKLLGVPQLEVLKIKNKLNTEL